MVTIPTWIVLFYVVLTARLSNQSPSCTYGARGSLTSTCTDATPIYFRTTNYRFDNLDETVRCVSCNLQVIEGNTFDISGNQIKNLDLTNSQIQVLKPKSFIGLVFLQKLLLPNNRITVVPADTFQGINKVRLLNLQDNAITTLVLNGFKELVNLEQLNLRNNRIKTVEKGALDGLASLQELDLANNEIETVTNIFSDLLSVSSINLEGNKISQINAGDINDIGLVQLNLARNNLKNIPANVFLGLPRLESLNLSSNPIETLTVGAFRGLYSIEDIDLSNGAIADLQKGIFQSLRRLRNLDLSNNRLSSFTTGIYSGLPELRGLNLSHNKIDVYQKTGVFPLHSLHTLDLSFNNLKDLDYERLVEHLPSLSHLELNNNPWPCYLGKEMESYFKNDGLVYCLGKEFDDPNLKCNDSRQTNIPKDDSEDGENSKTAAMLVDGSNGHEYVLYVFMGITIALMCFLFYLQYRSQKDIREIVGKSNISEVHLLSSSDLEAKDDY